MGLFWVTGCSFVHCVTSPFHSFVTGFLLPASFEYSHARARGAARRKVQRNGTGKEAQGKQRSALKNNLEPTQS